MTPRDEARVLDLLAARGETPSVERTWEWASVLAQDPLLLEPPKTVLPWLAWEGRLSLLAAPEKSGKSTIVGQAVAATTRGEGFLGGVGSPGPVAWLAYDEPAGDALARLKEFGADLGRVCLADEVLSEAQFAGMIAEVKPVLVVVDTLVEHAATQVESFADAKDWQPLLAAARRSAKAGGFAILFLHHTTRDGSRYADSRQIGAGVDAIVEMTQNGADDPALRVLKVRARRVGHRQLQIRFGNDGRYYHDGPPPALADRIVALIENEPGISASALRNRSGGRGEAVDREVDQLVRDDLIERRKEGNAQRHYPKAAKPLGDIAGPDRTAPGRDSGQDWASGPVPTPVSDLSRPVPAHAGTPVPSPIGTGQDRKYRPRTGQDPRGFSNVLAAGPGLERDIPYPVERA